MRHDGDGTQLPHHQRLPANGLLRLDWEAAAQLTSWSVASGLDGAWRMWNLQTNNKNFALLLMPTRIPFYRVVAD